MALRDIFKFRELPESETSKPFLEHLEDLRWTIVKMAITLILAMIICFAFRGMLVRVMQAPLHEIDQNLVSFVRSVLLTPSWFLFISRFTPASSFPSRWLLFFIAEFVLPALTLMERKVLSSHRRQFAPLSSPACLFAISGCCQKTISSFSRTHSRFRLGAGVDA